MTVRSSCLLALACLVLCRPAVADVVTDWNNAALDSIRDARMAPPPATRALAMMHLAIYDAVNGLEQVYEPYAVDFSEFPPPRGASVQAAAAAAAHTVLVELFPDRVKRLNAQLNHSLTGVRPGAAEKRGVEWGRFVGEMILALRDNDGAGDIVAHEPLDEPGRWQPTPPGFAAPLFPQWPFVTPFAMQFGDDFREAPPPPLDSLEYALAFHEVKELGAADSPTRTADQTRIAYFWEDGPGSVTPPGRWQLIAQDLADRFGNSLLDNARMFALLSMIQADAAICCWDMKYHYDHWRPVTGIPLADFDGNDLTEADLDWEPLIPTPAFPAYTSGHSTFSGSSAELLALFFDDDRIALTVRTPNPPIWPNQIAGHARSYSSLREAAEEAGQSRIYGGIHWQYDNVGGLESGRALAQFVFAASLRPLED